ncbi:MAG: DUF1236 domain-containing protein [Hyphomicrobiales bacterium]|nr:DUF1236 domain-containing protein [Hyphomicrobiales bacterium]
MTVLATVIPAMTGLARWGTLLAALLLTPAVAPAQLGSPPPEIRDSTVGRGDPQATQLRLTEAQRSSIVQAVRSENKAVTPPPSFNVTIGASVPPAIELYLLPDSVLANVPEAKQVKYTVVQNQIVLVDPTTMRVVDVIAK